MGYVDNAPYFCMVTETVAKFANEAMSQREKAHEHLLEMTAKTKASDNSGAPEAQSNASCKHLPAEQRSAMAANFDIYLDDFISVVQGGPMKRHLPPDRPDLPTQQVGGQRP